MSVKNILLIRHLRIHNANALSSPYTIGFPAMTAWLGAVHALQRKLKSSSKNGKLYDDLHFSSVAVACHHINLQTYKGENDFVQSIVGTGNPLNKSGKRPSFIEEARCHLDVSLVIEYRCRKRKKLVNDVDALLKSSMKIAGGDILSVSDVEILQIETEAENKKLMGKLMPSYCLIERRDLMQQAMQNGQDAMDALLDYLAVHHRCEVETSDEKEKVTWKSARKEKGWIVPIAIGFQGFGELGLAEQQRDADTPHRFAESIVTLGEFVMSYHVNDIDNILWKYYVDLENHLYLCKQNKPFIKSEENNHG